MAKTNDFFLLKRLHTDNKGQLNIIGNILEFIKTQPWIMAIIFLALLLVTTIPFDIGGGQSVNLSMPLNAVLGTVADILGFGFDWQLFVILCFLMVSVGFILKYGHP